MKKLRFIYDILWFFGVDRILLLFCRGTFNVYYHGITIGKSTPRHINYYLLERQIIYFQKHLPGRINISFDDGYHNLYHLVSLINKYNLKVTVFVTTMGLLKNVRLHGDIEENTLISDAELEILSKYIEIGSHGHTHISLATLENPANELKKSKWILEATIGRKVDMFCFPFGEFSEESIRQAKQAGYTKLYGCGIKHPEVIPRYGMCTTTTFKGSIIQMLWKFATSAG